MVSVWAVLVWAVSVGAVSVGAAPVEVVSVGAVSVVVPVASVAVLDVLFVADVCAAPSLMPSPQAASSTRQNSASRNTAGGLGGIRPW